MSTLRSVNEGLSRFPKQVQNQNMMLRTSSCQQLQYQPALPAWLCAPLLNQSEDVSTSGYTGNGARSSAGMALTA